MREELRRTRERGYAIKNGENFEECRCIGAAILSDEDRVLDAISICRSAESLIEEVALTLVPEE